MKKEMAKLLLYVLLTLPFALSAQNKEMDTITQLEQKKSLLEAEVRELQDSISKLDKKLEKLRIERAGRNQTIEIQSNIPQFQVNANSFLLSRPHKKGKVLIEVAKGSVVQKIDRAGKFYLVCLEGNCGYLPSSVLALGNSDQQ